MRQACPHDFSTLYTTLPHNLIKEKLLDLIEWTFKRALKTMVHFIWHVMTERLFSLPLHTCDISLFRRDLPIFEQTSLFGISKLPYITYTSPYFKFQISLFEIKNFLLCLIILPILKCKSPYLASQMYHMYASDQSRYTLWSCQNVCDALSYLLDNISLDLGPSCTDKLLEFRWVQIAHLS